MIILDILLKFVFSIVPLPIAGLFVGLIIALFDFELGVNIWLISGIIFIILASIIVSAMIFSVIAEIFNKRGG